MVLEFDQVAFTNFLLCVIIGFILGREILEVFLK